MVFTRSFRESYLVIPRVSRGIWRTRPWIIPRRFPGCCDCAQHDGVACTSSQGAPLPRRRVPLGRSPNGNVWLGYDATLLEQTPEVQRAGRALAVDLEFLLCARAFRLTWPGRMRRIHLRAVGAWCNKRQRRPEACGSWRLAIFERLIAGRLTVRSAAILARLAEKPFSTYPWLRSSVG